MEGEEGEKVHLNYFSKTDFFLFFFFFTETRNSQMQVKKQKIFYNIKKSSVVGGWHVTVILSTFGQHGLHWVHGQEVQHIEGGETVPGGALASAASN